MQRHRWELHFHPALIFDSAMLQPPMTFSSELDTDFKIDAVVYGMAQNGSEWLLYPLSSPWKGNWPKLHVYGVTLTPGLFQDTDILTIPTPVFVSLKVQMRSWYFYFNFKFQLPNWLFFQAASAEIDVIYKTAWTKMLSSILIFIRSFVKIRYFIYTHPIVSIC